MGKDKTISIKFRTEFIQRWRANELVRGRIVTHVFVAECNDTSISFREDVELHQVSLIVDLLSQYGFTSNMYKVVGLQRHNAEYLERDFKARLRDPGYYAALDLGPDVAESEPHLDRYFVRTQTYYAILEGTKKVVVGPKGSGKSAIKKMIYENNPDHCIVVTPEHYATTILDEVLSKSGNVGSKEQAFATAWKYTLLIEILRKLTEPRKGFKTGPYSEIHSFLRDHVDMVNLDIFARFVRYVKQIEGIKLGDYEVGFKTTELRRLYSLEALYQVLPALQKTLTHPFYILIDELDQGWNNSENSNNFIIGLFLAANELNSYHEMLQCCVFIRGEIFDLVCHSYGQVDKLRHVVESIAWKEEHLLDILCRRLAFSMGMLVPPESGVVIGELFDERDCVRYLLEKPVRYLVERTCMRPREIIHFLRLAHKASVDNNARRINGACVTAAEGVYSKHKLEHLCSEYSQILPGLRSVLESFRFKRRVLSYDQVETLAIESILNSYKGQGPTWLADMEPEHLIQRLYDVEFLGVRFPGYDRYNGFCYSFDRSGVYVRDFADFQVHPGFWKHLSLSY